MSESVSAYDIISIGPLSVSHDLLLYATFILLLNHFRRLSPFQQLASSPKISNEPTEEWWMVEEEAKRSKGGNRERKKEMEKEAEREREREREKDRLQERLVESESESNRLFRRQSADKERSEE